jgi:FeS assembly SUF system protein
MAMQLIPVTLFFNSKMKGQDTEAMSEMPTKERIVEAIRSVYDPEISVNVYDLGLIYTIDIDNDAKVKVQMTLTAPGCPVAGILPAQVASAIKSVPGVQDAQVELIWNPPWSQECMSDEAKLTLGLF